ncbi:MAG: transporter substrate-binding domain-containing protein [Actinobacteria bacterium]|nr:transporter substrate-binding domain-containing protein [Actinomycetota bacterium]
MNIAKTRLLAMAVVAGLALAGCGSSDDAETGGGGHGGEHAGIKTIKEGRLTVCSDVPYAPFEFEEGGQLKGIDIDLVKAIATKLDLEADFRDTDFDGIFAALAAGNCDMIASSVSITEERKKENNFSDGYFEINQSLLVRKGDESKYSDFASLKGRTIGVQSETTGAEFATAQAASAGVEVKEFTGADELFTALKANQIDGVVQDFPVNSYHAETTGDTVVSKVFTEADEEEYGFVIPKKSTALLEAVNEALGELRSDGTYARVLEQYLGEKALSS